MKWIKASERLPEQTWHGVVKWTDSADYAVMSEFGFCNGSIYDYGDVYDSQPLEWLDEDESPQPSPAGTAEELREIVFQAMGYASMCWSETPGGVFEDRKAVGKANEVMAAIESNIAIVSAGKDEDHNKVVFALSKKITDQSSRIKDLEQGLKNLISKSEKCYDAVEWPADGTSDIEIATFEAKQLLNP